MSLSDFNRVTLIEVLFFLLRIVSLFAIYFFIWGQMRIRKAWWRTLLVGEVVALGLILFSRFTHLSFFSPFFAELRSQDIFFFVGNILFTLPLLFILFLLGFRERSFVQKKKSQKIAPSRLAVVSMVLGLLAGMPIPFLRFAALVTGIIALVRRNNRDIRGKIFAWMGISSFLFTIVLLIAGISVAAFLMRGPALMYRGNRAIENMNQGERAFLSQRLIRITRNSTPQDVYLLLGKPSSTRSSFLVRSDYFACPYVTYSIIPGNCTIKIDFIGNKATKITWIDIKKFSYTRDLLK